MNGLGLLIAVVAFGQVPGASPAPAGSPNIQFGWNLEADNKFAYILHVPPAAIETMLTSGDELESNMPTELVGLVSRVVVKISESAPVRSHTLQQLGDLQKQAARERQSRLPGNALATLSDKTENNIVQIDRNRDGDSTNNATTGAFAPPPLQSSMTPPAFGGTSNNPFAQGASTPDASRERDRSTGSDPKSLPSSVNTPAAFSNPNDGQGSSIAFGANATNAQQPVVSSGLPPSARTPTFPNTNAFPPTTGNNLDFAGSPTRPNTFGPTTGFETQRDDRSSFNNPNPNGGAIPRSGSSFESGFPTTSNQNFSNNNEVRLADARGTGSNLPNGLPAAAIPQNPQTQTSPGDIVNSRTSGAGSPVTPQRDRLLPILFMLSFVANVYMAILMSKLVGRYRTLLSSVRGGVSGYGDSLTA
jgi:hypothetical protein